MASHLLQYLGQAAEVAIGKMLGLPQVQDHSRRTGFGGKVVQISEWDGLEKGGERLTEMNGFSWMRRQEEAGALTWFDKWFQCVLASSFQSAFFHFDHKDMMETWNRKLYVLIKSWGDDIYFFFLSFFFVKVQNIVLEKKLKCSQKLFEARKMAGSAKN